MTGNRTEVVALELDDTGSGVATVAGARVHVADLLPGERAEVVSVHTSPHKAEVWARIVRRIGEPSPDRVAPACPAFGRCGGCVWQHIGYPAQLVAKRARVVAALGEAAGGVAVAAVRPSPIKTGYRNKGKYVVGRGPAGRGLVLGAYAPRSHNVVDTVGCRVVAPIIDEVASWVRGAAERAELTAYSETARDGELRYVIIREAAGDVLVVLVHTSATPRDKLASVATAMARHTAVRGLVAIANDRRDGSIVPAGSPAETLLGEPHLVEQLAGAAVEVGAGEFVQVNRAQAAAMYARVAELAAAQPGSRAVDLYAGLGGIGLHLARAGAHVIAVERDRDAVAALSRAASAANLPLTALAADAGALPAELRHELGAAPDIVVVNPPRKGLDAGARALLADLAAPTLLYISCGPDALGRDLAALATAGYRPDAIEPFDLMPGTAQVETVVRLRRP
jgi:23S rRNA (uracil1939-C5)-methyltransferase